jgi:hypothetical protein
MDYYLIIEIWSQGNVFSIIIIIIILSSCVGSVWEGKNNIFLKYFLF